MIERHGAQSARNCGERPSTDRQPWFGRASDYRGPAKLLAEQIENLLEELTASDSTIARTVLNVALDAADPPVAARRYLAEYRCVAEQLKAIDPDIARTVANATFMTRVPRKKAMHHFKHFADLFMRFRDDVGFARTVARAAFRSRDPIKSAKRFSRRTMRSWPS